MWPFQKRKASAAELLLDRFLQLESDRLSHRSDLEAKREELEVKKLEIELTHLEARTKAQIELDKAQQELRLQKREAGRKGQQVRRAKLRAAQPESEFCCPLGENPNLRGPALTPELIRQHALHVPRAEIDANGNGLQSS